jgi:hypothetical protein
MLLGTTASSRLGSSSQDFQEDGAVVTATGGPSAHQPGPYTTTWDQTRCGDQTTPNYQFERERALQAR